MWALKNKVSSFGELVQFKNYYSLSIYRNLVIGNAIAFFCLSFFKNEIKIKEIKKLIKVVHHHDHFEMMVDSAKHYDFTTILI